jgi:metal transporter CNNM
MLMTNGGREGLVHIRAKFGAHPPPILSTLTWMVPTLLISARSPRPLFTSLLSQYVPTIIRKLIASKSDGSTSSALHTYAKRDSETTHILFACLIPVLVLLSGVFAGLTLGYMSLDETQLNVLSMSGTPFVISSPLHLTLADRTCHSQQKRYADKIKPIRKNGHLLLVTLLLANMIVNETLPVISDPVLGGGVQSVVVSTVLIVM